MITRENMAKVLKDARIQFLGALVHIETKYDEILERAAIILVNKQFELLTTEDEAE